MALSRSYAGIWVPAAAGAKVAAKLAQANPWGAAEAVSEVARVFDSRRLGAAIGKVGTARCAVSNATPARSAAARLPYPMKERAKPIIFALLAWFCFALAVGASGKFHYASAVGVAATVWTLTALALAACWKIRTIRDCLTHIDVRELIAVHLTRFVGIYLLILGNRGRVFCFGPAIAQPKSSIDLECTRLARYYFRRVQRAAIWIERLAINGAPACTSAQPFANLCCSADYRVTRSDLCPVQNPRAKLGRGD